MPDLPPIEVLPRDLSMWEAGNVGTPFVHRFDSFVAGPSALVVALTHGNEFCGAETLHWALAQKLRPRIGSLVLAFANVAAYRRFDATHPLDNRFVDRDMNRVWREDWLENEQSLEAARARQLRPFVDAADFVLDIHSMHEPCRPLMVCGQVDKNAAYARELGVPGDVLLDTGHPAGLRMIERGGFADPASPKRALLIECGQHWERAAEDVAIDTLLRFLRLTGAVDAGWASARLRLTPPAEQRVVRVTEAVVAKSTAFRFLVPISGLGVVEQAGTPIAQDGDQVWVAPYDQTVLVMPSMTHLRPGNTQVRLGRFVEP
jgi:predicted deacylase